MRKNDPVTVLGAAKSALIFLSFALPLILAPFLLGGVYTHLPVNMVLIALTSTLYLCWGGWMFAAGKRLFVPYLLLPFGVIILWGLFQLLPLPPALTALLSPKGHYFHTIAGPQGWRPLTMSLPDTIYSLMRTAVLVLFAVMLQRTLEGEHRGWRRIITDTIILSAVAVFAFGFFLKITGQTQWLGSLLRGPLLIHPTLINMNHAAAFFGIAALLSLSMATDADFARARVFYGALFFVNLLGVIMTLSRGGILAVLLAILLFGALKYLKHRTTAVALPTLFVIVAVLTAFYIGYRFIVAEFDMTRPDYFDKFALLATVREYFADFWLTGSGFGSFMHVYPYYQGDPGLFFIQLENEPVQFALEHGIVVALIAAALFVWFFVKYNRGTHLRCGAAAILLFLLMHNTLDFNLHDLAILFPAVAVYLMASGAFELKGWRRHLFLGVTMVAAAGLLYGATRGDELDFYRVKDTLAYETLIERYPADLKPPLREALRHYNAQTSAEFLRSLPYLSEATAKAPYYYFVYYLTGSALLRLGSVDGALPIFAESIRRVPDARTGVLLKDIFRQLRTQGLDRRMRELLPFDRPTVQPVIAQFIGAQNDRPELVEYFIEGREIEFFETAGNAYMQRNKYDKLDALLDLIQPRLGGLPGPAKGRYYLFRGASARQKKDYADAILQMERGTPLTGSFADLLPLAQLYIRHAPEKCAAMDTLLQDKALIRKGDLASYYRWKSDWFMSRGELRDSLKYLLKGADIGDNPQWRIEAARRLAGAGLYDEAIGELTHLRLSRKKIDIAAIDKLIEEYRSRVNKKQDGLMKELLLEK